MRAPVFLMGLLLPVSTPHRKNFQRLLFRQYPIVDLYNAIGGGDDHGVMRSDQQADAGLAHDLLQETRSFVRTLVSELFVELPRSGGDNARTGSAR